MKRYKSITAFIGNKKNKKQPKMSKCVVLPLFLKQMLVFNVISIDGFHCGRYFSVRYQTDVVSYLLLGRI
ncbi:hypothetical protein [Aeromonas fluvialis]|uniref:hypothetical protein n=1 Tax=Aeromonas fluvialis TaxID=591962 RepID=UPI0012EDBB01|nr:hypothetical protein [Aeromonas fluvialis]